MVKSAGLKKQPGSGGKVDSACKGVFSSSDESSPERRDYSTAYKDRYSKIVS